MITGRAFAALRHSSTHLLQNPPKTRNRSASGEDLIDIAKCCLAMSPDLDSQSAKPGLFERHFTPMRLPESGTLTGYYEPVFEGRLIPSPDFSCPLHKRPADLIAISTKDALEAGFTPETSFARKDKTGLKFHFSRADVMAGCLDGQGLELVWLKNPLDAYIIHIQGSARIRLEDGSFIRIAFDGKSGHPYQSLGKKLIEQGVFTPETITMDKLIAHLRSQGEDGLAILAANPSYIYFKQVHEIEGQKADDGPIAAAGIPLQSMRSIAVDRHIHTFGLPFWIESTLPAGADIEPFIN